MNYTYKYQFPSKGQYALVDAFYRNIWFTNDDEQLVHRIKKIFAAKLNALVIDLSVFENFDVASHHISSTNSLHWHIPRTNSDPVVRLNVNSPAWKTTVKQYQAIDHPILSVRSFHSLLAEDRAYELHDQILLYFHVTKLCHNTQSNSHTFQDFQSSLDEIFQTEISLLEIELKLADLARCYFGTLATTPGCIMDTIRGNFYE